LYELVLYMLALGSSSRGFWGLCLAGIIAVGILSRVVRTGSVLFDKYLGDALYAAMVYALLRLFWRPAVAALCTAVIMTVVELFQLTMIPAGMLASEHLWVRVLARLMGTQFSFLDLLAYAVGIGCIYLADSRRG
jgi:hypothetical protein